MKKRDDLTWLEKTGATVLVMPLCVALFLGAGLYYGWALSILWDWFMVPGLGLPKLSLPHAIGVSSVVSYMTYRWDIKSTREGAEFGVHFFLRPLIALFCGWLIKLIFGV